MWLSDRYPKWTWRIPLQQTVFDLVWMTFFINHATFPLPLYCSYFSFSVLILIKFTVIPPLTGILWKKYCITLQRSKPSPSPFFNCSSSWIYCHFTAAFFIGGRKLVHFCCKKRIFSICGILRMRRVNIWLLTCKESLESLEPVWIPVCSYGSNLITQCPCRKVVLILPW